MKHADIQADAHVTVAVGLPNGGEDNCSGWPVPFLHQASGIGRFTILVAQQL